MGFVVGLIALVAIIVIWKLVESGADSVIDRLFTRVERGTRRKPDGSKYLRNQPSEPPDEE